MLTELPWSSGKTHKPFSQEEGDLATVLKGDRVGLENFDDLPKDLKLAQVSCRDLFFLKIGQSPPGKSCRSVAFDMFQEQRGRAMRTGLGCNEQATRRRMD